MNPRVQYVECGCGRRYEPRDFLNLKHLGIQKDAGFAGGDLLLANCACGSPISMEVTPDRWWECDTGHEHATREERDACDAQEHAEDKAAHPMDYEATE